MMSKNLMHNDEEINRIVNIICEQTGIKEEDFYSKTRKQTFAVARHTAAFFCYISKIGSLQYIGYCFGDRDHTTILNSIERVKDYYQTNKTFRSNLDKLCLMIDPSLQTKLNAIIENE